MFVQAIPPTQKSGGIHPPPPSPRDLRQWIEEMSNVRGKGQNINTLSITLILKLITVRKNTNIGKIDECEWVEQADFTILFIVTFQNCYFF